MAIPGEVRRVVDGVERCQHRGCGSMATHEMVGETDSFGSEYYYYCTSHIDRHRIPKYTVGVCEHCCVTKEVRMRRDPEEGMNGPLYELCDDCHRKMVSNFD